ncbi:MAG: hypothetical protein Q8Q35_01075 [Nanoarchaeota archaeon]|nr:hypothetical protein [Nanoarchaeota archaeon]
MKDLTLLILNIIFLLIFTILVLKYFILNIDYIDEKLKRIRKFISEHKSVFKLSFLAIFLIEQLILIGLIFKYQKSIEFLKLIVSLSALIIITTASLQEFILEIRVKNYKKQFTDSNETISKQKQLMNELITKIKSKK